MTTGSFNEATVAALAGCLERHPSIAAAYLLGSAVQGRLRPESDLDVAVLPTRPHGLPIVERLALAAELSQAAGRDVDLGILSTSSLVYAKEAVAHGRLFFERDREARARFAMYALSMYASLQEARQEVIAAYAA